MITHEQNVKLYVGIGNHFGMPKELYIGVPTFAQTEGYSVGAIIDAGYNIGKAAREKHGPAPSDDQFIAAYEELIAAHEESLESARGTDFDFPFDISRAITRHKDIVLRVARELWDLFPEIYKLFGQDYPNLTPEQFFGQETRGHIFIRSDQVASHRASWGGLLGQSS